MILNTMKYRHHRWIAQAVLKGVSVAFWLAAGVLAVIVVMLGLCEGGKGEVVR